MKRRRWALIGMAVAVLLAGAWLITYSGTSPAASRVITLHASQWRYAPEIVTVHQGDRVTLRLESGDVAHGFYLDGYGIERDVLPGQPVEVHFVATRAGRWMFRCSMTCGPFHPYMIGWLRVEPNTALRLGWLAVGAIGLAAVYMAWEEARER